MSDAPERRRDTRYAISPQSIEVYDRPSGQLVGTIANLSAGGLMMIGDVRSGLEGVAQLQLRWHDGRQERRLELATTTLWQTPSGDGKNFWSGHQIIDISPDDQAELMILAEAGEAID